MNRPQRNYIYDVELVYIVDGDTFDFRFDLGLNNEFTTRIRLLNVDSPEKYGLEKEAGLQVKRLVENLFAKGYLITVETHKDKKGSFGRYLANVWVGDIYLNDAVRVWSAEARKAFKIKS